MLEQRLQAEDVIFLNRILLLDTGAVMSARNQSVVNCLFDGWNGLQRLPLEYIEAQLRCVKKARETLKDGYNGIVVPTEVGAEVQEHLDFFRERWELLNKANGIISKKKRDLYKSEHEKLRCLSEYIKQLELFQQENIGYDPRYARPKSFLVCPIQEESPEYKNTWQHYFYVVMKRHIQKDQDLSEADIALATLSHLLQRKTRNTPCIITRDNDFKHFALTATPRARLRERQYENALVSEITSSSYSLIIYMPRF